MMILVVLLLQVLQKMNLMLLQILKLPIPVILLMADLQLHMKLQIIPQQRVAITQLHLKLVL